MFHEILQDLITKQEILTNRWAEEILQGIPSYRLVSAEQIRGNTQEHFKALLHCIETGDELLLRKFLVKIAPERSQLKLPLSETQKAFMIGKALIWKRVTEHFSHDLKTALLFLKLVDDCFCQTLYIYSEIYQRFQLRQIEKHSRALIKAEAEKKYWAQLQTEYQRLDEIVSAIGGNLALIDKNRQVVWTNRLIRDRVGENVLGKMCHEIYLEEFSPCETCIVEKAFASARQQNYLRQVRDEKGRARYFQIVTTPILDENKNVREVLELIQDVTELKRLERKLDKQSRLLQSVLDSSADAVIGLDRHRHITSWNRGAEIIFGYSADEALGRDVSFLVPEDLKEIRELEKIEEQIYQTGFIRNYETERLTKDGRRVQVEITRTLIYDSKGKVLGSSAIVRDITERKKLEKRLLQSERLATIGKMAARIAHEIRNPLSSISLNAELLEEEILSFSSGEKEEAQGLLRAISEEVDRLTQLTEEYLQFSRLPQSHFSLGNVNAVLEDLLNFMAPEIQKRHIHLEVELDPTVPEMDLDRSQLRQAFVNIIRNALEAMPRGGMLSIVTRVPDENWVDISISDTGEGIRIENITKIFDPFYTTKDVGTGLGLPMSQQIISDHHGSVTCQSTPGKGTTFRIRLPRTMNRGEKDFG